MKLKITLLCAVVCLFGATVVTAQDAAKVDPKHYKVESENDQVRVLRVHYGPGEKSVMHSHPGQVVVYLTDGTTRFHTADGKSEDVTSKAGTTTVTPAVVHSPENIGKAPFDAIVVELKGHKAAAGSKAAATPAAAPKVAKK
jgi:quercetin dioxygenase-like cupin family protein